jgi:predicted nucleotidyltransferase component of viral defense system
VAVKKAPPPIFGRIQKIAIVAMFSDDDLMEKLVLKGGSALSLVHRIGTRSSIDVDFSLAADFDNVEDAQRRISSALRDRFDSEGFSVFDFKFETIGPHSDRYWGGYNVLFKVMEKERFERTTDPIARSKQALTIAPNQKTFEIQISKYEYCGAREFANVDGFLVRVYTPVAIVIEKLRALCQQLKEYTLLAAHMKRPRPRDYYDIHTILTAEGITLSAPINHEVIREIFSAKDVPLSSLSKLDANRDFHRQGFEAVVDSVLDPVQTFDYYADYLRDLVKTLEPLWDV